MRRTAARATTAGSALGIAVGWNVSNLGAAAGEMAVAYDVSLATVGLFTTALFVVHACLQIPAGRAVDRFGARRVGLAALALLAATAAVAMIAPIPALVVSMRALAGAGTALGFVAGSDYVRAQGGSHFAQGLYGGVALGAGGLALAVVPLLEGPLAWRAPFASAVFLAAVAAIVLAAGPVDAPRRSAGAPTRATAAPSSVLGDRRLYPLCVIYMASLGLSVVLANWVVELLTQAGGYGNELAGAVGSLILLGGVVSRPLGGWIARVRPRALRDVLAASFVVSAAGTVLLTVAGPPALSVLGALLLGLSAGIPFAASFGAAARVRPDAPAAAVGMVNMAANLVIVVGTPLLGLAFSLPGDGRVGFAAATALWLVALAVVPAAKGVAPRHETSSGKAELNDTPVR